MEHSLIDFPGCRGLVLMNGSTLDIADLNPGGVALDGAVQGPVMGDDEDRWSFDHHAGCHRLITAATCEQVFRALKLGFSFEQRHVYVNDLDADTVLSLWLIRHASEIYHRAIDLLRLVHAVGTLDAHGPPGLVLLPPPLAQMADDYVSFVVDGARDSQQHFDKWPEMLLRWLDRTDRFLYGDLEVEREPGPHVDILFQVRKTGHPPMCMARCKGFRGFDVLYRQGFQVVCLAETAAVDTVRYTIGKTSDLVRYRLGPGDDAESLLGRLNAREPGWGGGSSIGGSPRLDGGRASSLSPKDVWNEMTRGVV